METRELAQLLHIPDLPLYLSRVEESLKECFASAQPATAIPALRLIDSGGKRFRSTLVIATAASQGAAINADVIRAAVAIELVHLGSIVHDDVLDHATERGGVPSIYGKEGTSSAILIGDYMLAAAAHQAALVSGTVGSVVAGVIMEMCEGQTQETVDAYNVNRSLDDYRSAIHKKTAALIAAACQVGGLCAKAPAASLRNLQAYGEAFGIAFQLIDDLLDFLSTTEAMGKPVHNDVKEGVYTMPLLLSLQGPSAAEVRSWIGQKPEHPVNHVTIVDRLLSDGSFEKTLREVQKYNNEAMHALQDLKKNSVIEGLLQFPELYLQSALKKQTALIPHDD